MEGEMEGRMGEWWRDGGMGGGKEGWREGWREGWSEVWREGWRGGGMEGETICMRQRQQRRWQELQGEPAVLTGSNHDNPGVQSIPLMKTGSDVGRFL